MSVTVGVGACHLHERNWASEIHTLQVFLLLAIFLLSLSLGLSLSISWPGESETRQH